MNYDSRYQKDRIKSFEVKINFRYSSKLDKKIYLNLIKEYAENHKRTFYKDLGKLIKTMDNIQKKHKGKTFLEFIEEIEIERLRSLNPTFEEGLIKFPAKSLTFY